jgi:hypothetical protein
MTLAMPARTMDPWRISEQLFAPAFSRTAPSTVNFHIVDHLICDVLDAWGRSDTDNVADVDVADDVTADDGTMIEEYPQTPVDAVRFLARTLQISQDQVLAGVGVAGRSFFQWADGSVTRPRPASLGRLWPMVEAIAPLRHAHPNLAAWFHSTPAAQEAFAAGRINELLTIEFNWASANSRAVTRPVGSFGDPANGVDSVDDGEAHAGADSRPATAKPGIRRRPRRHVPRGHAE